MGVAGAQSAKPAGWDIVGPRALSLADVARLRTRIERIGRLSDGLVRLGPIRLGWDALLEWIPGVGEVYSLGAGGWMIAAGARAHLPASTLAGAAALIGARTLIGAFDLVPLVGLIGDLAAGLFRGHARAARLMLKAMDATLYVEGPPTPARKAWAETEQRRLKKARVVFLDGPEVQAAAVWA